MEYSLNKKVLLLNSSYEPLMVVNGKKAIVMMLLDKADYVSNTSDFIRSVNYKICLPSIIKLKSYRYLKRKNLSLTRKNILFRDNNVCQYCGESKKQLTIDHVIPKDKGGLDSWENLVSACSNCNIKKGNRYLHNVKMELLNRPIKPSYIMYLQKYAQQEYSSWKPYLYMNKD